MNEPRLAYICEMDSTVLRRGLVFILAVALGLAPIVGARAFAAAPAAPANAATMIGDTVGALADDALPPCCQDCMPAGAPTSAACSADCMLSGLPIDIRVAVAPDASSLAPTPVTRIPDRPLKPDPHPPRSLS